MKNTFKEKYIIMFFGVVLCFLVFPTVHGIDIDDNSQLKCEADLGCNGDQYSEEKVKKLEELEKIILEYIECINQSSQDTEKQDELFEKGLDLAEELGILQYLFKK